MRLHSSPVRLLCLMTACLLLFIGGAQASESALHREVAGGSLTLEDLSIGYNGLVTYTKPIPLTVTVSNTGADVSGVLAVNLYANQRQYDRYELPLTLAGGTRRQVTLTLRLSSKQETFTVEFISEGETLCAKNVSPVRVLNPETLLVGVLSPEPASLSYLNINKDNDELRRDEAWQAVALSKESFPENETLLQSFGLLMVDGFDALALSEKQLTALDGWLRAGGILWLGGGAQAATVYPAFSAYTGLTPGSVRKAPDITGALAAYLGVSETPLGQEVLINDAQGGEALISSDGANLLYRTPVGEGLIYTAAFEWGAKPLASWSLMHTLPQRLLLKDCPEAYQSLMNLSRYAPDDNDWSMNDAVRSIRVENNVSAVPMLALAVAYLLAGGVGGYLLLKKLDKREWLWGLFPVLTAVCVLGIFYLGRAGGFSQPMAATFTHYNLDAGGSVKTYAALSTSDGAEHLISSPDGDVLLSSADYSAYYSSYYDEDAAQKRMPTEQRYRFHLGETQSVSLPFGAPWTVKSVVLNSDHRQTPDVRASLWPEADGLHGVIENRTDFPLKEGVVLTSMGFCAIPDLQPGEKAEFALIEQTDAKKASLIDGALLPEMTDNSSYSIINAYLYPTAPSGQQRKLSDQERTDLNVKSNLLTSAFSGEKSIYENGECFFRYVAFQEDPLPVALCLDGREITRSAHQSMLSLAMDYSPVGPDGTVFFTMDLIKRTIAEGDKVPQDTGRPASGGFKTYRPDEPPTFCFTLPESGDIDISSLRLSSAQFYSGYVNGYLYNWESGAWDVLEDGEKLTGAQAAPYFKENKLFVQYRAPAGNEDGYIEIRVPSLEIRGRVK